MKWSRKEQIKKLYQQWDANEWEAHEIRASNMDPDMKSHYLNDVYYDQVNIETQIEMLQDEIKMLPLRVMLYGFTIFALGLLIYRLMF